MINTEVIDKIYNKLNSIKGGKNADYIPELKKINPNLYAISIFTIDGEEYNIGDYNHEFAIESCSKVFTLALALKIFGIRVLKTKIGEMKTTYAFNSIKAIETNKIHTVNSFHNGGAMATTSLLYEKNKEHFEKKIIDNMSYFAGRQLHVSNKIYKSEINNSELNMSLAYLLKSYDKFYGNVEDSVDVYTRQCSTMVTSRDIAIMAATLANNGINPKTNKKIIHSNHISYILKHMENYGLYEETDKYMETIGYPIKSGVSGVLLMIIPGKMGIGIASPPLNKNGNSFKGLKTANLLAKNIKKIINKI